MQMLTCVFLRTTVLRSATITPTSAPHMTIYKIPDVPLQPPKTKTDTFQKSSSVSSPQTRPEAEKTVPRTDPGLSQTKTTTWRRTPGISLNPIFTKIEANKSIPSIGSSLSQTETDALGKTQGIHLNPSKTEADSFKNISGNASDQLKPDQHRISNTITKTPTIVHPPRTGRPASGEPTFSLPTVFRQTYFKLFLRPFVMENKGENKNQ